MNTPYLLLASATLSLLAPASRPAACPYCTLVGYTLTVSPADSTRFTVEMRVHNPPQPMRVAFAADPAHPDERPELFGDAVRDIAARTAAGSATVTRESSSVWRVATNAQDVVLTYHVAVAPAGPGHTSWASTVRSSGAVVRPHSTFLHLVDRTAMQHSVRIVAPSTWSVTTALFHSADGPSLYTAPSFERLLDAPILLGRPRAASSGTRAAPPAS